MVQVESSAVRPAAAGRIPPHNLEAEESLLGAMLLSRDAITAAVEARVEATDFYKPAHGHVFDAVWPCTGRASRSTRSPSPRSCAAPTCSTRRRQAPRCCRSRRRTPASANAGHYARIVNELALLRRLIAVAGDIAEMGYDVPDDVTETLDRAESLVFEVAERRVSDIDGRHPRRAPGHPRPARAAATATTATLTGRAHRLPRPRPHPARAPAVEPRRSSRPARAWARPLRARRGAPTSPWQTGGRSLFFSMEMGTLELTKRLLAVGGARRRQQAADRQAHRGRLDAAQRTRSAASARRRCSSTTTRTAR